VFFVNAASGKGRGGHENVGTLVKKKISNWKHSIECFNNHANTEYHRAAVADADNFVDLAGANKLHDIQHRLDKGLAEQVKTIDKV
jgi:hypothetical protein